MEDSVKAMANNIQYNNVWGVIYDNEKFMIAANINKIAVRISRNKPLTEDLIEILKEWRFILVF